jgi:hypothetical protein
MNDRDGIRLRMPSVLEGQLFYELIALIEQAAQGADLEEPPAHLYQEAYRVGKLLESIGYAKTPTGVFMIVRESDDQDDVESADLNLAVTMEAGWIQALAVMGVTPPK